MSLLNETLKSLDDRHQQNDFGLPPTIKVSSGFPYIRVALLCFIGLIVYLVVTLVPDKSLPTADKANIPVPTAVAPGASTSPTDASEPQGSRNEREGLTTPPLSQDDLLAMKPASAVSEQVFDEAPSPDDEKAYRTGSNALPATSAEKRSDDDADITGQNVVADSSESYAIDANAARNTQPQVSRIPTAKAPLSAPETTQAEPSSSQAGEPRIITREPNVLVTPKTPQQQSDDLFEAAQKAFEFGIITEAKNSAKQALIANPMNQQARELLVSVFYTEGDVDSALAVLAEGIQTEPTAIVWRELSAKIFVELNRIQDVIAVSPNSLDSKALREGRSDYLIIKGTAAQAFGEHAMAVSAFNAMAQLQPTAGKWSLALAISYQAQGMTQSAMRAYQHALAKGGLSAEAERYAVEQLSLVQEQN